MRSQVQLPTTIKSFHSPNCQIRHVSTRLCLTQQRLQVLTSVQPNRNEHTNLDVLYSSQRYSYPLSHLKIIRSPFNLLHVLDFLIFQRAQKGYTFRAIYMYNYLVCVRFTSQRGCPSQASDTGAEF